MTVTEAFIRYDTSVLLYGNYSIKTRTNYRSALNSFVRCVGDIPVELVHHDNLVVWKQWREMIGHADSTIAGDISRMKQVFRYLRRLEVKVVDSDTFERPKIRKTNYTWLTAEEVGQLLSVIENLRDRAFVSCLFGSGARIGELLSLNRDSIVNGEAQITGKGDKIGVLRFGDDVMHHVNAYMETRKDNLRPLFISSQHRRISPTTTAKFLHKYTDWAGIDKNVTHHVLRHSFATDMRLNGADLYDVKEQLRHDNISTTQLYVHIGDTKRKEVHEKYHTAIPIS